MEKKKDTIILFDVDGTLTKSRNVLNLFHFFFIVFQKRKSNKK